MKQRIPIDELQRMALAGLLMLPQPFSVDMAYDEVIDPVMGNYESTDFPSLRYLMNRGLTEEGREAIGGWVVSDKGREFLNEQ